MGVSKESISKFLIGNRFHVKLCILSPYSNRINSIWILFYLIYFIWINCICSIQIKFEFFRFIILFFSIQIKLYFIWINSIWFYLNKDWGCVILREIDFLLKICWSIPCLHLSWKVHTWIATVESEKTDVGGKLSSWIQLFIYFCTKIVHRHLNKVFYKKNSALCFPRWRGKGVNEQQKYD